MELALWRDIAVVWLAFLCFIGLIVPVAISVFAVKGMHAAVDRTPQLLRQVQGYSRVARTKVEATSQHVVEPVIQTHKQASRFATLLDRVLRRHATK